MAINKSRGLSLGSTSWLESAVRSGKLFLTQAKGYLHNHIIDTIDMLVRWFTFGAGSASFSSQAGEGLVTQESLWITPVKQIREMLHLESTRGSLL